MRRQRWRAKAKRGRESAGLRPRRLIHSTNGQPPSASLTTCRSRSLRWRLQVSIAQILSCRVPRSKLIGPRRHCEGSRDTVQHRVLDTDRTRRPVQTGKRKPIDVSPEKKRVRRGPERLMTAIQSFNLTSLKHTQIIIWQYLVLDSNRWSWRPGCRTAC